MYTRSKILIGFWLLAIGSWLLTSCRGDSNWYGSQNPHQLKELGDVGNDLQQYGHRLYAVINCSHKVEVMDLQARHIAKIDIPNKDEQFLRERLYEMYNNPVINHNKANKYYEKSNIPGLV